MAASLFGNMTLRALSLEDFSTLGGITGWSISEGSHDC
jgi:hypothetical protein